MRATICSTALRPFWGCPAEGFVVAPALFSSGTNRIDVAFVDNSNDLGVDEFY